MNVQEFKLTSDNKFFLVSSITGSRDDCNIFNCSLVVAQNKNQAIKLVKGEEESEEDTDIEWIAHKIKCYTTFKNYNYLKIFFQ